jgi:cell fate (sporulation/competence/biofilm development) regulator YlbF (YheA/YmcA/DUF963 family)
MTIRDHANALVKALKASPEYKEFKKKQDKLQKDKDARQMLSDLRKTQWKIEKQKISGQQPTPKDDEQLNIIMEAVSGNAIVKDYLEGEYKFSVILNDIQKILGEAMQEFFTPEMWENDEDKS